MVSEDRHLKLVVAGLLLGILMAAMDNTIVATAMGTIVGDLGGLDKFVWVTSAYMVAVMAGMPIFGKLSDMYGRKRFFIFGLIFFLFGSALCGLAQNMVQLSIFRAIQGVGGGALLPIAFTIVFDIFPPEKRGKMTGLIGAVFGSASVFGPLLGATITELISWHWIFYVNVPIGMISLFLIGRYYNENAQHSKRKIDWLGAVTLVAAVVSLMFALEFGGKEFTWNSPQIFSLFTLFALCFTIFIFAERKAEEPIISFWMFKRRTFATAQVLAFLYGATFISLTIFIPIFVQAVYGGSAASAGFILTPMMLGSVLGSGVGGAFQTKTSYRNLMIISIISFGSGMLFLSGMTPDTSRLLLTIFMVLAGFGVGFNFSLLPVASIHDLEPRFRGSANSTNAFFRSLGMTIGITVFGAIQNKLFVSKVQGQVSADGVINDPRAIFDPSQRQNVPEAVLDTIINAMSSSITTSFTIALIPISIAGIVVLNMGNAKVIISKNENVKKSERVIAK